MVVRKILLSLIFLFLWFLFVLYPNPYKLIQSVYRFFNPPICTESVIDIIKEVEEKNPSEIEKHVLKNINYRYDWETYRHPWYFPTVAEVIEKGEGDCKSRLVVIASIFEKMEIEYTFLFSTTHVWIDYNKKEPTENEKKSIAIFSKKEGFKVPDEVNWKSSRQTLKTAFWDYMPQQKKAMFLSGPFFSILLILIPTKYIKKYTI